MESRPLLLEDNASRQLEDDVSINVYNDINNSNNSDKNSDINSLNSNNSNLTTIIHNDSSTSLVSNSSGDKCRICLQDIEIVSRYCECLNDLSHIHEECLFEWLIKSNKMNARIEEYDNHDEEYDNLYNNNIEKHKNNCMNLEIKYFYYCEICHYRYNIFNQIKKHSLCICLFDILIIISLVIALFYSLLSLEPVQNYFGSISSLLSFIFLIANLVITSFYSIHAKIYDNNLIILPHHSLLNTN
jgi:hypothetical protein